MSVLILEKPQLVEVAARGVAVVSVAGNTVAGKLVPRVCLRIAEYTAAILRDICKRIVDVR